MLNKLSVKTLIIILLVFAGIYALIYFFNKKGRSKSFKSELVQIDTAEVTKIIIDNDQKNTFLEKQSDQTWKVKNANNKFVLAETSAVSDALSILITYIKPTQLASRSFEKRKEFQVDSTGTRVQIYQGNKKTLDLIIGKFAMRGQREYHSYVRLYDENEIYACDKFMSVAFSSSPNSYRNSQLSNLDKSSIERISFIYLDDNSFALEKETDNWFIEEKNADSSAVAQYLSDISYININSFADDTDNNLLGEPFFSLVVNTTDSTESPLELAVYRDELNGIVLESSNSPNLYLDEDSTYLKKIFKTKDYFFDKVD